MLPENQSEVLNDAVRYAIDGQRNLALSEIKSLPSDASDHGVHIWSAWLANSPSEAIESLQSCLLYTSPSPRDQRGSRMPSSA